MLSLQVEKLKKRVVPVSTGWLLGECMEAKGRQELWTRQRPEVLTALREQAIIQSVESSNRIEGVTVSTARLRPIVLGKAKPRDRSEEELAGYRKALDWIFSRKISQTIESNVILRLHSMAQGGFSGDAGQWKQKDNEIIEFLPDGKRVVRFKPTTARKTPQAIEELCRNYQHVCEDTSVPLLLTISTFVFDFLCIHPFRDGNGRLSRLLTLLLLRQQGFEVGRYVSLERIVEDSKADYYRVLGECSQGWHEGANDLIPWWNYFLGILRRAYQEFAMQVETSGRRPAKGELVRNAVFAQAGPFALGDLCGQLPGVSPQYVKKMLAEMKKAGQVKLVGRGRGATWQLTRKDSK